MCIIGIGRGLTGAIYRSRNVTGQTTTAIVIVGPQFSGTICNRGIATVIGKGGNTPLIHYILDFAGSVIVDKPNKSTVTLIHSCDAVSRAVIAIFSLVEIVISNAVIAGAQVCFNKLQTTIGIVLVIHLTG